MPLAGPAFAASAFPSSVDAATTSFATVVQRSSAIAHDGQPLSLAVTVRAYRGSPPKYVAIVAEPGPDVASAPLRANLHESAPGYFTGTLTIRVRGRWSLAVRIARAREAAEVARIPLSVTAAGAPPRWIGWFIACVPLALGALFARKAMLQRRRPEPPNARTLFTRA